MNDVFTPKTLKEALTMRDEREVIPFAGGTDLMVEHFIGSNTLIDFCKPVLFLNGINEISNIQKTDTSLIIGAGVTFYDLIKNPDTPHVLRESALGIAGPPIRNIATIGGNICNASPSADSLPALYALNAQLVLQSAHATRKIPIAEFITGVGKTILQKNELLTYIELPLETFQKSYYRKIGTRKANALSKLAFCGLVCKENGKYVFRLSFCTMGITITRSPHIEAAFATDNPSEWKLRLAEIQAEYATVLKPRDSARSTAFYRNKTAQNLIKDFFEKN